MYIGEGTETKALTNLFMFVLIVIPYYSKVKMSHIIKIGSCLLISQGSHREMLLHF